MQRTYFCLTLGIALAMLSACSTTQSAQDTTISVATTTSSTTTSTTVMKTTSTTSIVAPPTTVTPMTTKAPETTIAKKKTTTTVTDPRSASEIASAFASAISKVIDNLAATGANVGYQKLNSIWAKYKALGATLSWYDAAVSPSSGTNAEFADNYRIALRGESFCYKRTSLQENDFQTVYASTAC